MGKTVRDVLVHPSPLFSSHTLPSALSSSYKSREWEAEEELVGVWQTPLSNPPPVATFSAGLLFLPAQNAPVLSSHEWEASHLLIGLSLCDRPVNGWLNPLTKQMQYTFYWTKESFKSEQLQTAGHAHPASCFLVLVV